MSKYTTGEIAKLCDVSVRTVQYYDTRGILVPSELSEGGRRLYSESALDKMKIICFLREIDLSIDSIKNLFKEENSGEMISMLLDEQKQILYGEIAERQKRVDTIVNVKKWLSRMPNISLESIGDAAHVIMNQRRRKRMLIGMLLLGLTIKIIEISTLILWIFSGVWLPFVVAESANIVWAIIGSVLYFRKAAFICPTCHRVFRTRFRRAFFANHTPYTRKLTCTHCGYRGHCVETVEKGETYAENQPPD